MDLSEKQLYPRLSSEELGRIMGLKRKHIYTSACEVLGLKITRVSERVSPERSGDENSAPLPLATHLISCIFIIINFFFCSIFPRHFSRHSRVRSPLGFFFLSATLYPLRAAVRRAFKNNLIASRRRWPMGRWHGSDERKLSKRKKLYLTKKLLVSRFTRMIESFSS